MKRNSIYIFFCSLLLLTVSFTEENPYYIITKKDVRLILPKDFPKPVYDFKNNKISPEGFTLGRRLFYDPILSKDSSTSCASCHQKFAAFAHIDHPLSHGINGLIGTRNVPALQNLIWQDKFMWDGSINHLELQPIAPITNSREMDESLLNVIKEVQDNKDYALLFYKAYKDTVITSERILKSLTQFLGLMISSNSKYDRFIRGEEKFTEDEHRGLTLFRMNCENCHKEPLFTDNSFRNAGISYDTLLNDPGRKSLTGLDSDYMKFKVPSLRNVELTYPYMHDGRFRNLQQVMEHYNTISRQDPNVDKSLVRNMKLTKKDLADLFVFLKTLTDQSFLHDRRFADPFYKL
ncbi:MAG TPA: cytochrome c peroxidase [Saprospiraceae bacterium]|nr:cytochrome c peroxidase [Saprospiraceae bacterium]